MLCPDCVIRCVKVLCTSNWTQILLHEHPKVRRDVHSSHQFFSEVTNQVTNLKSPIFLFQVTKMCYIRPNKKKMLCCPHRPKYGRTRWSGLFFFLIIWLITLVLLQNARIMWKLNSSKRSSLPLWKTWSNFTGMLKTLTLNVKEN